MELFIGIDFSKKKFDATVIKSEGLNELCRRIHSQFDNNTQGYEQLVEWVKKNSDGTEYSSWLFCGENTGLYSEPLCCYLSGIGLNMWLEDAYTIKHSMGLQRNKTDKADSSYIAEYAKRHSDQRVIYKLADCTVANLKELFGARVQLVSMRAELTQRIGEKKEILCEKRKVSRAVAIKNKTSIRASKITSVLDEICSSTERLIDKLSKEIAEYDKLINEEIQSDEEVRKNYEIITSIKGVAMQNATALIVYTNNFNKFNYDPRKLACFYGIAPFGHQSGTSVRSTPHTSNFANKQLKSLLTQAALIAKRYCPELREYYVRLIQAGKKHMVALNNLKNKLLKMIVAMVKNQTMYDPKIIEHRRLEYLKSVS